MTPQPPSRRPVSRPKPMVGRSEVGPTTPRQSRGVDQLGESRADIGRTALSCHVAKAHGRRMTSSPSTPEATPTDARPEATPTDARPEATPPGDATRGADGAAALRRAALRK